MSGSHEIYVLKVICGGPEIIKDMLIYVCRSDNI
jgi:hypothetical protein